MGTSSPRSAPSGGNWPKLKGTVKRFAAQGGAGGGPITPRTVTDAYVSALGGVGAATAQSLVAARVGSNLTGLLSLTQTRGLSQALTERGLGELIGKDSTVLLDGLARLIVPAGDTIDESIARRAALDVLEQLFGDAQTYEELEERLGPVLTDDAILAHLAAFLARYVYLKMINVIKERLESGDISTADVGKIEKDLKDFIQANVRFELSGLDIHSVDWSSPAGQELVERLIRDAYQQLGD